MTTLQNRPSPDLSDCLAAAPVFSKLSQADRNELVQLAIYESYDRESFICSQGDIWPKVAFISSGQAEWAMLAPSGNRQVVFSLGPCDLIWGHSLFDDKPMPASLETTSLVELYTWHREMIIPIVSRNVEAVWEVSRMLVSAMRRVREVVYGFAFHPVAGRLAHVLLEHYRPDNGSRSPRDLTLDQLADQVGTTRELISKVLHQFAEAGIMQISRSEFIFDQPQRLQKLIIQE